MSEKSSLLQESLESYRVEMAEAAMVREPRAGGSAKRLKPIDRKQLFMRTVDVEKLVEEDHAVRAIWAMVSRLDMSGFEKAIRSVEGRAGQSSLDPRLLTALWIYGYSEGVNSARELSRMCGYEPGCQWLTATQEVNYHTLSDFRVEHKEALDEVFVQVLGLLSAEGLTDLTRVMQDGTKIKAQASGNSFRREDRIREHLKLAQDHVSEMGNSESEEMSQRVIQARQRAVREKKQRLDQALKELESLQKKRTESEKPEVRVSESDPEARVMKHSGGGFAPSYNAQISTEASHKIVVAVEITQAGADYEQLAGGVDRVQANTGQVPVQMVVDGGYISNTNIETMSQRGIDLIGPMVEKNSEAAFKRRGIGQEFYPDKFQYDPVSESLTCPAGKTLGLKRRHQRKGRIEYNYRASAADCQTCPFRSQCCPKNAPRYVIRKEESEDVKAFRAKMQTDEAKQIYRRRAPVAEFPNAWIKEKLGLRQFRLRGLRKVGIEAVWACLTYNIQQWKRLAWSPTVAAIA